MNRATPVLAAALLIFGTVAACSNAKPDAKPATQTASPQKSAQDSKPKNLADTYNDKLEAVSDGSIADCQSPSNTACASAIGAIMVVVGDLERDIDANGGASVYPKSTRQIAKMRAAQQEYEDNGCEGDPAADDPNSDCWGTMSVTVGATTLSMALTTDELSKRP
ncbi:hypothetical protein ACIOC2_19330 [Streptomyces sp. NPDC088337]|uniref:hypothetical protein n=1 Tax=unclassified Streptomyces TaxID=2593676 RepID=UPI0038010EDE